MTRRRRLAVFGPSDLTATVASLDVDIADDGELAVVDADDSEALARAEALPSTTPRVIVASSERHAALRALGIDASRLVAGRSAAHLGPVIASLLPKTVRAATRVIVATGTRGGVGRTLLVANLARRLSSDLRVGVVDATGSGAVAWWLRCEATSWTELEPLASELTPEQLAIVAREVDAHLFVVGAGFAAPSVSAVRAVLAAATAAFELVLVDAPLLFSELHAQLRANVDRSLVLTYDDPIAVSALAAATSENGEWIIASQSEARRVGDRDVLLAIPRDERAIAQAVERRGPATGRLGRRYDELAQLIAIDATR